MSGKADVSLRSGRGRRCEAERDSFGNCRTANDVDTRRIAVERIGKRQHAIKYRLASCAHRIAAGYWLWRGMIDLADAVGHLSRRVRRQHQAGSVFGYGHTLYVAFAASTKCGAAGDR